MVVEIRSDGEAVLVRRFGSGRRDDWSVVQPGERDESFTGFNHRELQRLGEGVWDFPAADRRAG